MYDLYGLAHIAAQEPHNLDLLVARISWKWSVLHRSPAQHFETAGYDIDDLQIDGDLYLNIIRVKPLPGPESRLLFMVYDSNLYV